MSHFAAANNQLSICLWLTAVDMNCLLPFVAQSFLLTIGSLSIYSQNLMLLGGRYKLNIMANLFF